MKCSRAESIQRTFRCQRYFGSSTAAGPYELSNKALDVVSLYVPATASITMALVGVNGYFSGVVVTTTPTLYRPTLYRSKSCISTARAPSRWKR